MAAKTVQPGARPDFNLAIACTPQYPTVNSRAALDQRIEFFFQLKRPRPTRDQSIAMQEQIKYTKSLRDALCVLEQGPCGIDSYTLNCLLKKKAPWGNVLKLFQQAPQDLINGYVISRFINIAGKKKDLVHAREAFEKGKFQRMPSIFTSFIDASGQNDQLMSAVNAFEEAEGLNIVDLPMRNAFIIAAGRNGEFEWADKTYQGIKSPNVITFNCYLFAAGNTGHLKRSKRGIRKGQRTLGIANAATF